MKEHDCRYNIDPIKLGRMIEQIDNLHEKLIPDLQKAVSAQNGRVRKLEINQAKLIGAIVVISTIASFAMKYFLG